MNGAIGLVVGMLIGVSGYRLLRFAADRAANGAAARMLRQMALVELCTMPIVGVLVGAYVIGN